MVAGSNPATPIRSLSFLYRILVVEASHRTVEATHGCFETLRQRELDGVSRRIHGLLYDGLLLGPKTTKDMLHQFPGVRRTDAYAYARVLLRSEMSLDGLKPMMSTAGAAQTQPQST